MGRNVCHCGTMTDHSSTESAVTVGELQAAVAHVLEKNAQLRVDVTTAADGLGGEEPD